MHLIYPQTAHMLNMTVPIEPVPLASSRNDGITTATQIIVLRVVVGLK
jgi:hypothetical protein